MTKPLPIASGAFGMLLLAVLLARGAAQGETDSGRDMEHGRYIVHNMCLCTVCHSPRDSAGELIEAQMLTGGTIPVAPPKGQEEWAFRAPKIAGLPAGWTEDEFVMFLQTGDAPHGRSVRRPMPPFRLSERDARAVAAYLLSLR